MMRKTIFITALMITCLVSLVACKQNNNKKKEKEATEIKTESKKKASTEKQKDMVELNQELEDFDQNYSDFLKGFYQAINEVNAFSKEPKKEKAEKERILKNLSEAANTDQRIDIPKNLRNDYQRSVDTLQGIYSEFISLQDQLKNYVDSEVWKENKRSQIYEFGEKAEILSRKYEHTYDRLSAKLQ